MDQPKQILSVIRVMTDRNGANKQFLSIIRVMTDRKGANKAIFVHHQGHDGQKSSKQSSFCPSTGS
ncbi:hypothetical protein M3172_13830 [Mesobacillus subterraneus]|uniref:hypothetical protein n=1 Tax=Mesobacillus subterraneus TaxID=285983 RepID=UPI00203E3954|nr:hypothetical protein [Mesobacillus subterraneus]MCM3574269.1 hypothetical protein [Mesobacillus subterraneus]